MRAWLALSLAGVVLLAGAATSSATPAATATASDLPLAINYGYTSVAAAQVGGASLTLSTASPSLASSGGTLSYQLTIAPGTSARSVKAQVSVKSASGTLVFQKTRYLNGLQTAGQRTQVLDFERAFGGSHTPGVYQVTANVTVADAQDRASATLNDYLVVYEAGHEPVAYVPVLRISAPPMRGADGSFEIDPASPAMLARADGATALANWVLAGERNVATLSIAPLMLEEWLDAANGYDLTPAAEGLDPVHVLPTDPIALRYSTAIAALADAADSGRLTVALTGYADPDLSALAAFATIDDFAAQYALSAQLAGAEGTYGAFGPSMTLSAPLVTSGIGGGAGALAQAGITRLVLPDHAVALQDVASDAPPSGTPSSGVLSNGLAVLVADSLLSGGLSGSIAPTATATPGALIAPVADLGAQGSNVALTVEATIGQDLASTERVLSGLTTLASQPWITLTSADSAPIATTSLTTIAGSAPDGAWGDSEATVAISAARARASLYAALAPNSEVAPRALRLALAAQCGADAGPADAFGTTARRLALATSAQDLSDGVLSKVSIRVASVTLPSIEGALPITIVNDSNEVLSANLRIVAERGAALIAEDDTRTQYADGPDASGTYGARTIPLTISPNETFVEQGVALRNATEGTVRVELLAVDGGGAGGGYAVSAESVTVKASYIEATATIGLVVLIGIALVAYVYSRARRAAHASRREGQWTE